MLTTFRIWNGEAFNYRFLAHLFIRIMSRKMKYFAQESRVVGYSECSKGNAITHVRIPSTDIIFYLLLFAERHVYNHRSNVMAYIL